MLWTLRLRGEAARNPTAQTLHVLMLMLLSLTATHVTISFIHTHTKILTILLGIPMIFTPVTTLVLLRKDAVRAAGLVYLVGMWLAFTGIILLNGGIRHVGWAVYLALAVSAAWLFGYGAALWMAGTCVACMLVVAIFEDAGMGPPRLLPGTPLGIWMLMIESTVMGVVPVTLVLSSLRRALEESRESEERFRRVFEEGPLGLSLIGKDYRFLKANNALCQMVGYSEAELLQLTFGDITHSDDLQADLEQVERLFRGEIPIHKMRKRYLNKSGKIVWINLTASVIRNTAGEPIYGLAMVEDITEVKRTQEEAVSRQKLETVGALAAGIAHDFNNLLGGILSEAELAETDMAADSAGREEIQKIKTAAMRGAEIVRELMIYAGQEQQVFAEAVDLSRLVKEMLELMKVSISKNATLRTNLRDNLPSVCGNTPQISQVVMNLVINASEAIGDKPGVITVTTTQVRLGRELAPNNAIDLTPGDYVQLEVSDTGSGITKEAKEKIFDPFFTTKFAGRGLGLAVVQGIVRACGGGIHIVSAPGQGTVFQVLLPCAPKPASEAPRVITSAALEQSNVRPGTILVVEDEETLRQAVSKALGKQGLTVLEAGNGSVALDLVRAHDIEAVLLDVTLPGMSSRQIFQEILRMRPKVKVIVTSAYGVETVAASFPELQLDQFIRKPFRLVDLLRMLESAVSAKTSDARTPETPSVS